MERVHAAIVSKSTFPLKTAAVRDPASMILDRIFRGGEERKKVQKTVELTWQARGRGEKRKNARLQRA